MSRVSEFWEGAKNLASSSIESITSSVKSSKESNYKPLQQYEPDLSTIPSSAVSTLMNNDVWGKNNLNIFRV